MAASGHRPPQHITAVQTKLNKTHTYCPANETFLPVWTDAGFSPCFLETIFPSILCGLMLLFGALQLFIYYRRSKPFPRLIKPVNAGFRIQVALLVLLPLMILFRFAVQATVFEDREFAHYMIAYVSTYIPPLLMALVLVMLERNYELPSRAVHRHGVLLLGFWSMALVFESLSFASMYSPRWWWRMEKYDDRVELGLFICRFTGTLSVLAFGIWAPGRISTKDMKKWVLGELKSVDETGAVPLLKDGETFKKHDESTFSNFWGKVKVIAPYIWPRKNYKLQLYVILSLLILVAGRAGNLLIPVFYKYIVDSLTDSTEYRYDLILIYVGIRFLQGGGQGGVGLLNNIRQFMWISIQQYTTRELEVGLFGHLHSLSLRWHLSRKTGEILRVMDRGTGSVNQLLDFLVFQIVPTIADITVAIVYFVTAFNAWFGLIVFVTMALYLAGTIWVTEWRTKYRRTGNLLDNETRQKATDSLINYETVKYYNTENYEINRYKEAVMNYQKVEWLGSLTMCLLNLYQSVVTNAGFAAAVLLCAWMVVQQQGLKVGDYVLLGTYIVQLYGPLGMLANFYRMIQMSFVDMENMFDLLDQKEEVVDLPNAPALKSKGGEIEFRDVFFAYETARPILKGVSFKVPAGHTVALVGQTGSGKSTILRLLFRFYDVQSGQILFDGQDITKVKQSSLRQAIGVVPQDTVLFNASIRYNIRYGKITAEDLEVEDAARAADIHDRILSFPEKYETVVGERGLKLSGGEKQRVAIARTVLKNPVVVLLDEATSALDTQTERHIQASLAKLYANRTTLIVAHRLSTVIHADEILVLKDGEVEERGNHEALLAQRGLYYSMWEDQLKAPPKPKIPTNKLLVVDKDRTSINSRASSGADLTKLTKSTNDMM
ncbi:ATP-binding cassette sub-family B member 6, mitochondrial [Hypsibius exemplaris]|uniref:ATP-binding cassette sub-family B member 6 n=1 Tax=Hypsibius exemplaris TaxID=2072580 RepID=A0A9X6NDT6_HYPEX|nr:ATP-binding cassette sub-family B member 6, mitochondrial [Hypsibius exemplaris]